MNDYLDQVLQSIIEDVAEEAKKKAEKAQPLTALPETVAEPLKM